MYQYSSNPWATHLDELEVFVGNIIGTNHNLSKRQRESSSSMREGKQLSQRLITHLSFRLIVSRLQQYG